jgi:hypothetical protein
VLRLLLLKEENRKNKRETRQSRHTPVAESIRKRKMETDKKLSFSFGF